MRKFAGLALILWLTACAGLPAATPTAVPVSLAEVFPGPQAFTGWAAPDVAQVYNRENVFNLVDGQAEAFFAYGFEQVGTQKYKNAAGQSVRIEIWQVATPADAYGLFTTSRSSTPVSVGNEGSLETGRRVSFWQNRFYVSVFAAPALPDAELMPFAQAVAAVLPVGGERPALVQRLPQAGMDKERAFIFFREELSVQDEVWLGGANLLGLGRDTEGVVARYHLGETPARLLLIQYPNADKAAAGLQVLQGGQIADLIVAEARGNLLGAVLGKVDPITADALLKEALK